MPRRGGPEVSKPGTNRNAPAPRGLVELAERASKLSSTLVAIADFAKQLGRGLSGEEASTAELNAAVAIAGLDTAPVSVSAWVGVLVLESPAVKRWQRVLLLEALRTRGIHRDLTDLPNAGAASAGGRLAVAARRAGSDPSRLLVHAVRWAKEPFASVPTASDASLLAWTLEPNDLDWLGDRCRGGPLEQVVGFASWLQAVERGRDPDAAPNTGLTRQWFECRSFRGPRRLLARRRGVVAGRNGVSECEAWLGLANESSGWSATPGQASVVVEWAIAVARAWPDRETLVRINDPALRARSERLRSSAAACIGNVPCGPMMLEWLGGALRALTTLREGSRTVQGHRAEVSEQVTASST